MFDVNELRKNYREFTDARIVRIAKHEVKGLRKETVPILINELRRRNLGEQLVQWVEAEANSWSVAERAKLHAIVTSMVCERCGQNSGLRGYKNRTLVGAIITSFETDRTYIACASCGSKDSRRSWLLTLFLGWWSLPTIFQMPFLLIDKIHDYAKKDEVSEEIINQLMDENTGRIRLSDDEVAEIQALLHEFNAAEEMEE